MGCVETRSTQVSSKSCFLRGKVEPANTNCPKVLAADKCRTDHKIELYLGEEVEELEEDEEWTPKADILDPKGVFTTSLLEEVATSSVDVKVRTAFLARALGKYNWRWPTSATCQPRKTTGRFGGQGGMHLMVLARQLRKSNRAKAAKAARAAKELAEEAGFAEEDESSSGMYQSSFTKDAAVEEAPEGPTAKEAKPAEAAVAPEAPMDECKLAVDGVQLVETLTEEHQLTDKFFLEEIRHASELEPYAKQFMQGVELKEEKHCRG